MKTHLKKRLTALFTAAALALGPVPAAVAAGAGAQLHTSQLTISESLDFVNTVSQHSVGRMESYAFDYRPGGDVSVVAWSGQQLWGYSTIDQAAAALTEQGYYVLGGVNADFFSSANGVPMGLVIRDGRLLSSNDGRAAVAFRADGSAFLTAPTLRFTLTNQGGGDPATGLGLAADEATGEILPAADHAGQTVEVHHFNKLRQSHYLYLLSADFAANNKASAPGRDIVFRIVEGEVTVSGQVTLEVTQVYEGAEATPTQEGYLILTANAQSPYYDELTKFAVGDSVTLTVECDDPRLAEATQAVGGGDILARDGALTDAAQWDSAISSLRNPRTAVGIRADGSVVFYAVDGRRSAHSNGLSLAELAEELLAQGCQEVLNLDGGGSTSLLLRVPTDASDGLSVVNLPSDGSARRCSTFLFLVSTAAPDGQARRLYLQESSPVVLVGSTVSLGSLSARDGAWRPAPLPASVQYTVQGSGSFDQQQLLYTAGNAAGTDLLRLQGSNGSDGLATITVVEDISALSVTDRDSGEAVISLSPEVGDVVALLPQATALGRAALSTPADFTYALSGPIGSITEDGIYTAGTQRGATGTITVSFGSVQRDIPVTVGEDVRLLEDFEGETTLFTGADSAMTVTGQSDQVYLGRRAGALHYSLAPAAPQEAGDQADDAPAAPVFADYLFAAPLSLDRAPSRLALWVCGDGSGVALSALLRDGAGREQAVSFGAIDFTGYAHLSAAIGLTGSCQLVGFRVTAPEAAPAEGAEAQAEQAPLQGVLYLDQLVAPGAADPEDRTAPTLSLSYEAGQLTALLSDDSFMTFTPATVSLTVDGAAHPFALTDNVLAADVALEDGLAHRVTLTAGDVFGNLTRSSLDVAADQPANDFTDVAADHWAADYIAFLSGRGVILGVGEGRFSPGGVMTREAFCTMLSRYLGLDTAQYAQTELPFTDGQSISPWALEHVTALYALGYVGGRDSGDGTARFVPADPITRGEIFTLLGRLVGKGYACGAQAQFADQDSIPDWALDGVQTTVGMGLVSGYDDGTIRTEKTATRAEVSKLLYLLY